MKILHVIPSFAPAWRYGGPIVAAVGLTRELARRGHDVTVATTNVDGPGELDVPLDRPVPMDGVDVWYFPDTAAALVPLLGPHGTGPARPGAPVGRGTHTLHLPLADYRRRVLVPTDRRPISWFT